MMASLEPLFENFARLPVLAFDYLVLSLLSVGGAASVLPEMHRNLVENYGWMSSEQFGQLYALAQAAPGPNVLVVSLLGWQSAGVAGALVTTLAMIGPSCALTYWVDRAWRSGTAGTWAAWRSAVDDGLAPLTVGLLAAAGTLLAQAAARSVAQATPQEALQATSWAVDLNVFAVVLTVAAMLISWRTRFHPLWMIAAGAAAGVAGLV